MTEEIFLHRPHKGVPWGFRLIGGADSHLPIIVSKVVEGSIAEHAGLEEDVLLEKVNNIPTSGLTHAEVNQVILAADNEVIFTIKRVNLENLILTSLREEENNTEISNILRQTVEKSGIIEEKSEFQNLGLQKEFGVTMIIDNKKKEDSEVKKEYNNKYILPSNQTSGKKWTTFLQKPNNPKPKLKNQPRTIPKADQYRVVITKQPKPTFKPKELPQQETEIEEKVVEKSEEIPMELEISLETHVTEETEITLEDAEELDGSQIDINENSQTEVEDDQTDYIQYETVETENISTDVTIENPPPKESMSLEEQLAAVQKQLQELAQLPSSIQETLAVVTQQLAHIVGEKGSTNSETVEEREIVEETVNEETLEMKAESEDIEVKESTEEVVEAVEDASDNAVMEDVASDVLSDIREEQEMSETFEEVTQEEFAAAELERKLLEDEKQAKNQLETQERENIRPIILPGGRKWVDPDDVVVKVKNPKMTDEKICDTLESFSEVIVGKTKGINFLKYTPAPKNLEYLQRSEVYRLVHGMEPPVRGISLRSEKILAEQDYYTAGGN